MTLSEMRSQLQQDWKQISFELDETNPTSTYLTLLFCDHVLVVEKIQDFHQLWIDPSKRCSPDFQSKDENEIFAITRDQLRRIFMDTLLKSA